MRGLWEIWAAAVTGLQPGASDRVNAVNDRITAMNAATVDHDVPGAGAQKPASAKQRAESAWSFGGARGGEGMKRSSVGAS